MTEIEILENIYTMQRFQTWLIAVIIISFISLRIAKFIIINPVKYWIRKAFNNIF